MYFGALHARVDYLYHLDCEGCATLRVDNPKSPSFKKVLKAAQTAFKHLQKKGSYSPMDLTDEPYQELINQTSTALIGSLAQAKLSTSLKSLLSEDARVFGTLKANAQLFEAQSLLINEQGNIKSWRELQYDFDKLNIQYNENYLQAEYHFAVSSALAAEKWSQTSSEYELQYRTALDERVRETHVVLHDITLDRDDPFWMKFYPPNGWNCRCVAVEVLKGAYPLSDPSKAAENGKTATTQIGADGKNKLEIFRFNPGMSGALMPPDHPYEKVQGAKTAKATAKNPDTSKLDPKVFDYFGVNKQAFMESEYYQRAVAINPDIRAAEALSIHEYTGSFFSQINRYLRAPGVPKPVYDSIVKVAKSGLKKLESYNGVVFRGGDNAGYVNELEKAFIGKTPYVEKAFLSTSTEAGSAFDGPVKFMVHSKNGKILDPVTQHRSEKEILFAPGTSFRVTSFVRKGHLVEAVLEEI